ncbi:hypothetical protein M422DRAFT_243371 [Sphaerobolus stellatus SS14]|nr:hypothetical protein M422DRAFT_243371 [Sphaerobolus stellatus SS14]
MVTIFYYKRCIYAEVYQPCYICNSKIPHHLTLLDLAETLHDPSSPLCYSDDEVKLVVYETTPSSAVPQFPENTLVLPSNDGNNLILVTYSKSAFEAEIEEVERMLDFKEDAFLLECTHSPALNESEFDAQSVQVKDILGDPEEEDLILELMHSPAHNPAYSKDSISYAGEAYTLPTLNESDSDEAATSSVPEDEGHEVADAMDTTGDLSDSNSLILEDQSCEAVDTVSTTEESSNSNSLVDSKATTKHDFHISAANFEAFMMVFRQKKWVEQHAVDTAREESVRKAAWVNYKDAKGELRRTQDRALEEGNHHKDLVMGQMMLRYETIAPSTLDNED